MRKYFGCLISNKKILGCKRKKSFRNQLKKFLIANDSMRLFKSQKSKKPSDSQKISFQHNISWQKGRQ